MRGTQYLHPYMKQKADELVISCEKSGLKIKITDTWRTKAEQNNIPSTNTQVGYPYSYHCWGIAFDICRNDGKGVYYDVDGFFAKVGKIANSIGLDWGGNLWTDFIDKPHFQTSKFGTPKQLIKKYGTPEKFKATWGSVETPKQLIKKSENYHKVQAQFKLGDATMAYLAEFKYSEALFEAFLTKKPLSEDTKKYVLSYKFGKDVLDRVYGG